MKVLQGSTHASVGVNVARRHLMSVVIGGASGGVARIVRGMLLWIKEEGGRLSRSANEIVASVVGGVDCALGEDA